MTSYFKRIFRSLAPLKKKLVIKANEEISVMCPLVRARRSARGEFADGGGEFSQGEGGAERIMEGRSILTASFSEFIHELLFSTARGTGCRVR